MVVEKHVGGLWLEENSCVFTGMPCHKWSKAAPPTSGTGWEIPNTSTQRGTQVCEFVYNRLYR